VKLWTPLFTHCAEWDTMLPYRPLFLVYERGVHEKKRGNKTGVYYSYLIKFGNWVCGGGKC
jgi:hypothetical protein